MGPIYSLFYSRWNERGRVKKGFPEHYKWVGPSPGASVEAGEDYPFRFVSFMERRRFDDL